MAYKAQGTFNDVVLSVTDSNAVKALQKAWNDVMHDNNPKNDYLAQGYHDEAERIRKTYGYSGGSDGSTFVSLAQVITPTADTTKTTGDGAKSVTPVTDAFFNDVPTGVGQVTKALNGLDLNKLIGVGAAFLFLTIFGNFITKKRR